MVRVSAPSGHARIPRAGELHPRSRDSRAAGASEIACSDPTETFSSRPRYGFVSGRIRRRSFVDKSSPNSRVTRIRLVLDSGKRQAASGAREGEGVAGHVMGELRNAATTTLNDGD